MSKGEAFDLTGVKDRVWRTRTQFPASEWRDVTSTMKFTSVQWDARYEHVVDWTSNESRDEYFDEKEGWVHEINTGWNFKSLEVWKPGLGHHEGMVRVSVPYEQIMEYNYLYVVMGEQPVPGIEITRREHFFYFITSLNKISPSTTELWLELDSWTSYRPSVTFEGLSLLRGHYPHTLTSADEFLENPLENHFGLTEPEPDLPEVKNFVSSQNLVSFQKNGPRVCIATTADFSSPDTFWVDGKNVNAIQNPTSVAAPSSQWNERAIINNNTSSIGNNGLAAKTAVGATRSSVNGGLYVFSIDPTVYASFIMYLRKRFPQAVKTIKSVYILDSSIIDESSSFDFFGYSMKYVQPQASAKLVEAFGFDKTMFGYDSRFEDFAKLYTGQFAQVEISNLAGAKSVISIEDVAETVDIYSRVASVFPFLKLEAFLNGIGGKTRTTYAVKPLNSVTAELFGSSWEENLFDLDVPTYGIFAESREIQGVVQQIERYEAMKNAKVRRTIETLNAETEKANRSAILAMETANEISRINLDNFNSIDEITKAYTNESRSIDAEEYETSQSIGLNLANSLSAIGKNFDNSIQKISSNLSIDLDKVYTDYDSAQKAISRDWAVAGIQAIDINYSSRITEIIRDTQASETMNLLTNDSIPSIILGDNQTAYNVLYENLRTVARRKADLSNLNFGIDSDELARGAALGILTSGASAIAGTFNGASLLAGGASVAINSISTGLIASMKLNKMAQRWYANFYNQPFDMDIIFSDGSSTAYENIYSALLTDFENERLQMSTNFTREQNTLRSTSSISYFMNDSRIQEFANYSFEIASYIRNGELAIADRIRTDNSYVASNSFNFGLRTAYAVQTADQGIANRSKTVETTIANRISSVDLDILSNRISALRANALNEKNVSTTIANRTKTTLLSVNSLRNAAMAGVIGLDYSKNISNITSEYDSAIADLSADYARMVFEDAQQYGETSGRAWIDQWGHRGISVTVKRISKPSEEIVGRIFTLMGYRTEPIWIDQPNLSLMTIFTYWEADSVRISGNPINETNKEILRKVLERGTTVWVDPDQVNTDVDIYSNRSL